MNSLVLCLEEPSAQAFFTALLPKIINTAQWETTYLVFEGKQDLMKNLARRLRTWQNKDSRFIVFRDQDSSDCKVLKKQMTEICLLSGKPQALVRIACHELETFYLGDLLAVELGLAQTSLSAQQLKSKFRTPDHLSNAKQELRKLTAFAYREISGSRAIAPHLTLDANRSVSFQHLIAGIQRLCA